MTRLTFALTFLLIGLVGPLIAGFGFYHLHQQHQATIGVDGQITHISGIARQQAITVVWFDADGRRHQQTFPLRKKGLQPTYHLGETLEVRFHPQMPERGLLAMGQDDRFSYILLIVLTSPFALIGLVLLVRLCWGHGRQQRLLRHGQRVTAQATAISRDPSYIINGEQAWRIHCEGVDPNKPGLRRQYVSPHLSCDPMPFLGDGQLVVYVGSSDDDYLIDLRHIPQLV